MANPWKTILGALPSSPVTEGTITAIHEDGVTVTTFRGGTMRCRNPVGAQVGDEVEVQDQVIQRVLEGVATHYITI